MTSCTMALVERTSTVYVPNVSRSNDYALDTFMKTILLKQLPASFTKFTKKRLSVPSDSLNNSQLEASNENGLQAHKYDIRKTIKVARDLLSIRQFAQERLISNATTLIGLHPTSAQSLQEICIEYFNIHYGSNLNSISNVRVHNFLESSLVYSNHPLLGFLTKFFFMDLPLDLHTELNLWAYVEARKYLVQNNYINGISSADTSSTGAIEYITVRRAYALLCVNEMFRTRGKFGPRAVEDVYASVEAFPSIMIPSGDAMMNDIECDGFLELLCSELIRLEGHASALLREVIGIPRILEAKGLFRDVPKENDMQRLEIVQIWASKLSPILTEIGELLLKFIAYDDPRKGSMGLKTFCEILAVKYLPVTDGPVTVGAIESIEFVASCFYHPKEAEVCYVDFVSVLLAHVIQMSESYVFDLGFILSALQSVRRGIDDDHAQYLVAYVGYVQSLESAGLLWPYGSKMMNVDTFQSTVALTGKGLKESSSTLRTDGVWRVNLNPSSELPGNLSINKMALEPKLSESGSNAVLAIATEESITPMPIEIRREYLNLVGEKVVIGGSVTPTKPGLTAFELTDFVSLDGEGVYLHNSAASIGKPSKLASTSKAFQQDKGDGTTGASKVLNRSDPRLTAELLSTRKQAQGEYESLLSTMEDTAKVEVHKRLAAISEYEREQESRYQMEKERIARRMKIRLEVEAEKIRVSTAREKLESRNARRLQKLKDQKREQDDARVAALEELERRELAIQEEEKSRKLQVENDRREALRKHEAERQQQLELKRIQEEAEQKEGERLRRIEEKKAAVVAKKAEEQRRLELEEQRREKLLQTERDLKFAKECREREIREMREMRLNDINAAGDKGRALKKKVQYRLDEEVDSSEIARKDLGSGQSDQDILKEMLDGEGYVSELFKKLLLLQNKLKSFHGGNAEHERRGGAYAGFFMPLSFSGDIRFEVFDSLDYSRWGCNFDDTNAEEAPLNLASYDDINAKIAAKKAAFESERQRQRARMLTSDDIKNWTSFDVQGLMNWNAFFENERPEEPPAPAEEPSEGDKFISMIENALMRSRPTTRQIVADDFTVASKVPDSLLANLVVEDIQITPLRFGHVEKRSIGPLETVYYQIELPGTFSMLTIEVSCDVGTLGIYVSRMTPPTLTAYEFSTKCPQPSPTDSRVLRMTIPLSDNKHGDYSDKPLSYFVMLVGDEVGTTSTIWTAASSPEQVLMESVMERRVEKLQTLSNFGTKNLVMNFNRLDAEASEEVDRAASSPQDKIITREFSALIESGRQFDISENTSTNSDSDEDEAAAAFISRSGRVVLKRESSSRGHAVDPNFNDDLYDRPKLPSRQEKYELFAPVSWAESDFAETDDYTESSEIFHVLRQDSSNFKSRTATPEKVRFPPIQQPAGNSAKQKLLTAPVPKFIKYKLSLKRSNRKK